MNIKNRKFYSTDREYLATLRAEYALLGFDTSLEDGCLTVYSVRRKRPHRKTGKSRRNSH